MATVPPASWRERLQRLILAGAVGLGAGFLIGLGHTPAELKISMLFGFLAGLGISLLSRWLIRRFQARFAGLAGLRRTAAYAFLFFVSGVASWVLTGFIVNALTGAGIRVLSRDSLVSVGITGVLAFVIGLAFVSFERMKDRLAESIARLKEAEFAERELQLARDLQSRLLPPAEVEGEGYRVAARNLAARVVAGDFYDVFRLADGAVGLTVADVAGKGMAASLIMASAKARLPLLAADRPAEEMLRELNRVLAAELSAREFVALAFARYDPSSGAVALANAGLPDPYLLRKGEPPRPLVVPGPRLPLGVRREVAYEAIQLRLEPGDRLLLLTDGLAEAPTPAGEPLGYAALAGLMASDGGAASPLVWLDGVLERVRRETAQALEDDWTALVLERR